MTTPGLPSYRNRVGYQAMLLGGFSTLATALLVAGNLATKDAIRERQKEDLQALLNQVVPPSLYDNDLLYQPLRLPTAEGEPLIVYRGAFGKEITAVAYEISSPGYSGDIRLILGLDANGKILGVRVLSHTETPGLGDKIEVAKDRWILEFDGLSLGNPDIGQWHVKNDGGRFDAFSGATITPRAVVKAIREGLVFFQDHRTQLLDRLTITTVESK